jgi:integrase
VNRPRKSKGPYPPCFYPKHGAFYLVRDNKWTNLGRDLSAALGEYGRLMAQAKAGKLPALIDTTLARHTKAKGLADATKAQYKIAAGVLKRKLARFDSPDQVKQRQVAQIKSDGAASPNMTNRVVSLLRTLFGYWVEDQLCDTNPCIGIKRHEENKRTRLITDDEWWAIYDKAGPRLRVAMRLQFLTGQRINDVLKIKRSQLVEQGIEFAAQKTKKRLIVRWSPDLRSAVADAIALHGLVPSLYLLPSKRRKAPNYRSVLHQWDVACAAAGVEDARPNDQRAQSLTATKREGKNAQALGGHSTEAMTARYLRDRDTPVVDGPSIRQPLDVGQKGA